MTAIDRLRSAVRSGSLPEIQSAVRQLQETVPADAHAAAEQAQAVNEAIGVLASRALNLLDGR